MADPIDWTPYCGSAPLPAELIARWNFDPVLIALVGLAAFAYVVRTRDLPPARRRCFAAAIGLFLILYVSPLCALGSALFSARVVHHVLIMVALAPLLVASLPGLRLRAPGLGLLTAIQALLLWLWHAPPLYAWALSIDAAYWLMEIGLLLGAVGFWAAIRRASAPAGVAALLATMVQMGLLGALITFAPGPIYAPHLLTTQAWGLTTLEDQQLAGLMMWAPVAWAYLAAALVRLGGWLGPDRITVQAR